MKGGERPEEGRRKVRVVQRKVYRWSRLGAGGIKGNNMEPDLYPKGFVHGVHTVMHILSASVKGYAYKWGGGVVAGK
jgi:hypothetical protein